MLKLNYIAWQGGIYFKHTNLIIYGRKKGSV